MESMNREMKRRLQRQGQLGADGAPAAPTRRPGGPGGPGGPGRRPPKQAGQPRGGAGAFLRDVRSELRKVAWPSRAETANYATVVLISLIVLVGLIFVLDYAFAKSVLFLFKS